MIGLYEDANVLAYKVGLYCFDGKPSNPRKEAEDEHIDKEKG